MKKIHAERCLRTTVFVREPKKILALTILFLALTGLLFYSCVDTVFAIPHGILKDLHTITGVQNIWDLTCTLGGRIYGSTSDGAGGSRFFSYWHKTGILEIFMPNPGVEVYSLTTGCGYWPDTVGASRKELVYAGSYTAPTHGAQFVVYDPDNLWSPGTTLNSNPYIMGAWHTLVDPALPAAAFPGDAIIYDLETSPCDGKIYGGTGYAQPVGTDYAYLFEYDGAMKAVCHATGHESILDLTIDWHGWVYFIVTGPGDYSHLWVYYAGWKSLSPELRCEDLGPLPSGRRIGALTTGGHGEIYVGSLEDDNGEVELSWYDGSWHLVGTFGTDQLESIRTLTTGLKGEIYGGDFGGNFFVYVPQKGQLLSLWNPGPWNVPDANPAIVQAVPNQVRIRTLTTGLNGKLPYVYGGTGVGDPHLFSYSMCTPDVNQDYQVNILDLVIVAMQFGFEVDPPGETLKTANVSFIALGTVAAFIVLTFVRSHKLKKPRGNQHR